MGADASKNPGGARHVAVIMDGNGRWAEVRGLARIRGHRAGVESVRAVTRHAARIGLDQLTLYAFSTENWKRPRREVNYLMRLLERYLVEERSELMENAVRLRSIGRIEGLPPAVQFALRETEELTAGNPGMHLCLALNYGSRTEIADAARQLADDAVAGRVDLAALDEHGLEAELGRRLYQPDMPPLDLMIRTAGEQRLSNFLLWQMSYGEFWATDVQWPDFREEDLEAALAAYAMRVRRFGGLVKDQP
ncbi:MAG: polyprenyl diphosphate synthase [Planctomycetota bacterium]|jgi:undecaprenyl diphosphate synthase